MQTGPTLQTLSGGVTEFFAWWRDELKGLVPAGARELLATGKPAMILSSVDEGFLILDGGGSTAAPRDRSRAISELASIGQSKPGTIIGIRLPVRHCFVRNVDMPSGARNDLRQILDFDLERATPFKLKDVYTAHVIDGDGPGKGRLRVRQFVVKRDALDPLLADVRATGLNVSFVDCWESTPTAGLPVNFIAPRAGTGSGLGRILTPVRGLTVLAVALILSAVALTLWRYEAALADVQAQTAQARTQAAAVRAVLDRSDAAVAELARLQQMKLKQIPAIEVLEEVTRILPDTVWLNEFRIEGETLDMSGLAKAGAALPPLFERSALLADGALSAPLTLDPREDKERFSLRVRIKHQSSARETPAAETQN